MNAKAKWFEPLRIEDIIPGDREATTQRWCLRNKWVFVPDFTGGEPFVDPRCAAAYCSPNSSYKSAQNSLLNGVPRYPGGLVRMSEVMRPKSATD